jgi:hypothetical protein
MEKGKIVGLQEEINYLLSNLKSKGNERIEGKDDFKTLDAIQNGAIVTRLIKYGEFAMPYIERELKKVSPTGEKRRYEALSYVKERIAETDPK